MSLGFVLNGGNWECGKAAQGRNLSLSSQSQTESAVRDYNKSARELQAEIRSAMWRAATLDILPIRVQK